MNFKTTSQMYQTQMNSIMLLIFSLIVGKLRGKQC